MEEVNFVSSKSCSFDRGAIDRNKRKPSNRRSFRTHSGSGRYGGGQQCSTIKGEEVHATNARTTFEDTSFVTLNNPFQITGMSFGWASQEEGMTGEAHGLFYDWEGIRHRHSGVKGTYKFEQVAFILDKTWLLDGICSQEA